MTKQINSCLLTIIFCGFCLVNHLAFGAESRALVPQDILNLKRLSNPQISPSGEWIAFVVTQFEHDRKNNSEIWLVSRDGQTLKKATNNPGPDFAPRWSPDGKRIAFISRRDNDSNLQINLFTVKDESLEKLTDVQGRIRNLKWSTDNRTIAFLKTEPRTEEELGRIKNGDDAFTVGMNLKHTRLWSLNVESRTTSVITKQDMTVWLFNWSPDGSKIAVHASLIPTAEGNEYQGHLGLIDVQSGKETVLTNKINALAAPSFSPDGKWISYVGPIGTFKERGIIKVIPAEGGEPVELLKEYDGNVWDLAFHPKRNELIASVAKGPLNYLCTVNLRGEILSQFEMQHSIIPYWGDFWSISSSGRYAAFLNESLNSPTDVWMSEIDGSEKRQLTSFNEYLNEPSFLIGYFNRAPYDNPEIYRKNSPITYASNVKTPLLMVHGQRDLRVPISLSYQFYSALKHYGADVSLVVYPREGHGIREYAHQLDNMNRVAAWFKKYSN